MHKEPNPSDLNPTKNCRWIRCENFRLALWMPSLSCFDFLPRSSSLCLRAVAVSRHACGIIADTGAHQLSCLSTFPRLHVHLMKMGGKAAVISEQKCVFFARISRTPIISGSFSPVTVMSSSAAKSLSLTQTSSVKSFRTKGEID